MSKTNIDHDELKQRLGEEVYNVTQRGGTEAPFSGEYVDNPETGMYNCVVCGQQLFSTQAQFVTNQPGLKGWPSFEDAIPGSVEFKEDNSLGMHRTEVICSQCGAHLGHIFDDDSETKTGKHYCINSCSLNFEKNQ
ncbi:MAG TPA: peptide-methionine (R)-S-oxide reductase MsrB [Patescibacteria group bacterium]|nr:peptide-methionine (R)-S-oxide reductase MsrB [Patescibacteria group bacterium]